MIHLQKRGADGPTADCGSTGGRYGLMTGVDLTAVSCNACMLRHVVRVTSRHLESVAEGLRDGDCSASEAAALIEEEAEELETAVMVLSESEAAA